MIHEEGSIVVAAWLYKNFFDCITSSWLANNHLTLSCVLDLVHDFQTSFIMNIDTE